MEKKKSTIEKFMEKISPEPNSGCWLWVGAVMNTGYGSFYMGKTVLAHRASYRFFCEEIPEGLHVLHKCDTPLCVNPDHLFLGTDLDNKRDMVEKKRQAYGVRNARSKITPETVVQVRTMTHLKLREVSEKFGISIKEASRIRRRETWRHIE